MITVDTLEQAQAIQGAVHIEAGSPVKVYFPGDQLPAHCVVAPSEKDIIKAQLAEIDRKLMAQRWAREGHLGFGELIEILRGVPENASVGELVAYLRAIPPCGNGMTKLQQIEDQAAALRAQLAALP